LSLIIGGTFLPAKKMSILTEEEELELGFSPIEGANRVLVVDDERLVLMALEHTLKQEGHEVLTAKSGEEAISKLKEVPVALIVCDQRMPGMTGTEVMQKVQQLQPNTIRIILTGNSDEKTAIEAINVGHVDQFMVKPWDDTQFRQTVKNALEQYKLVEQNKNLQSLLLSKHKALAESHANLRRDLQLGGMIHETLLLGEIPRDTQGIEIEATTIPSDEIDGDFYDFYSPVDGILDVVIGDVMGKGIPAAVVGTAVKTQLIRFATPVSRTRVFDKLAHWKEDLLSPWQILSQVHSAIAEKLIKLEYFVCLFYARFNLEKRTFSYVDCGSAKPIHYQANLGKARILQGENFPIGMIETDHYQNRQTHFSDQDFFVFYSDGVTEARSPDQELYGTERLLKLVESYALASAEELIQAIKDSVVAFAQKDHFDDDVTLIVIKIGEPVSFAKAQTATAKFRSDLSQLKAVRAFVSKICKRAPGHTDILDNQMQLVINEAFCNIVKHGYQGSDQQQIVIQGTFTGEGLALEISDQGPSFDPSEVEEANLYGDQDDGFGWHIIRSVADQITYQQKPNDEGWNRLRIYKQCIFGEKTMDISHKTEGDVLVVALRSDNLDAKDAPDFKQKVIDIIASHDVHSVVFDLHKLKFIDSSGLGSFLAVLRVLNAQGGDLKLAAMSGSVRTMFELVSMHKIFEIYNTVDDAVRSFKGMQTHK